MINELLNDMCAQYMNQPTLEEACEAKCILTPDLSGILSKDPMP